MTDKKTPSAPPETPERFTLKTGTVVHVDGIPVRLVSDTEIESNQSNHDALAKHTGTTFEEYPKRVTSPDGVEKNVSGPEDEAAWLNPPTPRKTGLEHVSVESNKTRANVRRKK